MLYRRPDTNASVSITEYGLITKNAATLTTAVSSTSHARRTACWRPNASPWATSTGAAAIAVLYFVDAAMPTAKPARTYRTARGRARTHSAPTTARPVAAPAMASGVTRGPNRTSSGLTATTAAAPPATHQRREPIHPRAPAATTVTRPGSRPTTQRSPTTRLGRTAFEFPGVWVAITSWSVAARKAAETSYMTAG